MLINLRNALMAGKRLPYDAEVEYLESTGTQWIDTGVYASLSTVVQLCFLNVAQTGNLIFGTYNSNDNTDYRLFNAAQGLYFDAYGRRLQMNSALKMNIWRELELGNFYVKDLATGEELLRGTTGTDKLPDATLTLNHYVNGSTQQNSKNRWAHVKIYQNGVLVRDFIPVRVGTIGYLYDRVSGKLFGNAGTGDFVLGPDVVPVEWLGTTGSQCVDTGIRATPDSVIRCTLTPISRTTKGMVFWGAGKADGTAGYGDIVELADQYGNSGLIVFIGTGRAADGLDFSYGNTLVTTANCSTGALTVNDMTAITANRLLTGTAQYPLYIGCANIAGTRFRGANCRYHSFAIEQSGIIVGSFYPVRVGTDATSWEGAMMDVLTRRVYRNAGTDAFTYGNDLKYPIPAS